MSEKLTRSFWKIINVIISLIWLFIGNAGYATYFLLWALIAQYEDDKSRRNA